MKKKFLAKLAFCFIFVPILAFAQGGGSNAAAIAPGAPSTKGSVTAFTTAGGLAALVTPSSGLPVTSAYGASFASPLAAQIGNGSGPISQSNPLQTIFQDVTMVPFTSATAVGPIVGTQINVPQLGVKTIVVVLPTSFTWSAQLTFQWTTDNGNTWLNYGNGPQNCYRNDWSPLNGGTVGYPGNQWYCPAIPGAQFRVYVSSYSSGTIGGSIGASSAQLTPASYATVYAGVSTAPVNSTASTNAILINSGSHTIFGYDICNSGTGNAFFRFFDSGSAPTPGTTIPLTGGIMIPTGGCKSFSASTFGQYVNNGLGYDITGAVGSLDNTALTTQQVNGYVLYK